MSTLDTLRTRVEENIGEPVLSTGWFTPDHLRDWINAGSEMVFLKMVAANPDFFGVKVTTFSFISGQQEYSFASQNPFEIRQVEVTDRGSPFFLEEIDKSERLIIPENGEPAYFYWNVDYNGTDPVLEVGLVPAPDRSATNNAILHYIPRPRILVNGSDTSDLPQEYQELVIIWASILALRSDQRDFSAMQTEFNFRLSTMLGFASRGKSGGPQYVHYIDS